MSDTIAKIYTVTGNMAGLLERKNAAYGDSALNPTRVFSKLDDQQGLLVRMDDKVSRIMNSDELRQNDVWDLMGYLILLSISKGWYDYGESD